VLEHNLQIGIPKVMSNQNSKPVTDTQKKKIFNNFIINNLLLLAGTFMVFSGLIMQLGFHMRGPHKHNVDSSGVQSQFLQYEQIREIDPNKIVCGFNYHDLSTIHRYSIIIFSLLMIYHFYSHWKWYIMIITKHLMSKNKEAIILSVLFLLVAITGLVPWFIYLSGGTSIFRMLFIEIHDKITLILIVFLIVHFVRRAKWFATAYAKLKR
jgi:magnesium-transporting ATPase (P-type)